MAETLTYDPGTDTVTEGDALTPAEQDSLAVGESLEAQQDGLLAGKYENAEQLEKAYVELQKKLGEDGKEAVPPEAQIETKTEQEEVLPETPEESSEDLTPTAELISAASDEYYNNDGKVSTETLAKLEGMNSKDLVEAYIQLQNQNVESNDLSDTIINDIKTFAGGEKAYADIVGWAGQNLDKSSIEAFDSIVNSGSPEAIKLAVSGLKSQYESANGYEGQMVTGKAPVNTKDVFRSQAELVAAMSDKRYDKDPAYRIDIMEKLERSNNVQF